MPAHNPPPATVLTAFGLDGSPQPLEGGEGLAFRLDDTVLKRVHDPAEASIAQEIASRIEPDAFRLPSPLRALNGRWTVSGWSACHYVDGLRPMAPDWERIREVGLAFSSAASPVAPERAVEVLARRTHRWAVADRAAWGEERVSLSAAAIALGQRIVALGTPVAHEPRRIVHGDLTGNVMVDTDDVPVVLDVSLYLRPPRWGGAVVVADAVLWEGASPELASDFAAEPDRRDLLARALMFRMVAEQLATDPRHGAKLDVFESVVAELSR